MKKSRKQNKNNWLTLPNIVIYQTKSGRIEFRGDFSRDTIWGSLNQIAQLFGVQKAAISKHLKNIYREGELSREATVSILETVQIEGRRKVKRKIEYYNLDAILSVGYRVNSKQATQFRIWATKVLRQHLLDGYTINKKRLSANYQKFMRALADVKALLPAGNEIKAQDVLELVNVFANTWFSLSSYDKGDLPKSGATKKQISLTADELKQALAEFRQELITKKQTAEIFGQERDKNSIAGIVGNIFQSIGGQEVYPTIEEKAAHLLYFIVKNHPFIDGNKRSGAFAFVWFLRKAGILRATLTAEALTALTLLTAESRSQDKEKIIGLIVLLLK